MNAKRDWEPDKRREKGQRNSNLKSMKLPGGLSDGSHFLLVEIEPFSGSVERIFRLSENQSLWHKFIDSSVDRSAREQRMVKIRANLPLPLLKLEPIFPEMQ